MTKGNEHIAREKASKEKASNGTGGEVHIKENMTELRKVIENFSMRDDETHH